jgi:exosome complex RNA-binding protein Rrp42 (RNase PH superfamily)
MAVVVVVCGMWLWWSGEDVVVHSFQDRAPVPLSIHHTPVSVSFGICSAAGGALVLDPTDREELVLDARIAYSINAHKELCGVHKIGGWGHARVVFVVFSPTNFGEL